MARPNYFQMLEEISKKTVEAVELSCLSQKGEGEKTKKRLLCIRAECDKMVCELENRLFCDFIEACRILK